MLPCKVFGELEYIFGCFKLMFIILLIMVGAASGVLDYHYSFVSVLLILVMIR